MWVADTPRQGPTPHSVGAGRCPGRFLGSSLCCLALSFCTPPHSCPTALLPPHSSLLKWEVGSFSLFPLLPSSRLWVLTPPLCRPHPVSSWAPPPVRSARRAERRQAQTRGCLPHSLCFLSPGGGSLPRWGMTPHCASLSPSGESLAGSQVLPGHLLALALISVCICWGSPRDGLC